MSNSPITPGATRTSIGNPGGLLPTGTRLAGRYRIEGLLGVGGMGMVYRAYDERLDVPVALKVLREELIGHGRVEERFRREILLARQVTHKNVVRIHDLGEAGDVRFLTMDLVSGRSLRQVLEERGRLPLAEALAIARQVAEALAAAHAEDVVHRDLKPDNVLLAEDGTAYVTDFGVARSLTATGITRAGSVVGTPDYLSPEQAKGEEVDGRSDVYSLGLMLYEMVTGELPFRGGTYAEVLAQRLTGTPRDPGELGVELPARVRALLERSLARERRRRLDAAGLAVELGAIERGDRRPWSAPPWLGRAAAAVLVAAVLAAVGAAVLDWLGAGSATATEAAGPRHAVVVVPFADQTGRDDLSWASTGLAEVLADSLGETTSLRVVDSLRTVRAIEDLGLPLGPLPDSEARQLATVLDADRLVLGTLRSAGSGLRVDARLVAADLPGMPVEAFSVEGGGDGDVYGLVERLAAELRRRLEVPLAETDEELPEPTASHQAFVAYGRGVSALAKGDAVAAVPALEAATGADPGFAAAWLRLAEAYEQLGYLDRAETAAEKAVSGTARAAGSRLAYEARARLAMLAGDPKAAQRVLGELVARFPHANAARVALAEAYGEQGQLDDARAALEAVVAAEPNHPRAWFLLGKYAILGGESRQAVDDYLVRALVVQNRLGNRQGQADVLNALGIAHHDLGELERAEEHYRRAADLRREIGDRRGYAASLANLGRIQFQRAEFEDARARLTEALAIREEIGDRTGVANLHNEFGVLEEERGRYQEALGHFRHALSMRRDQGDQRALAESYNNVGFAYYLLGEYDNAGVYWRQALDLYQESANREGVVAARQNLGLLSIARGEWDRAAESFVAALEASRDLGIKHGEAISIANLGRVAQYQGRLGAAFDSFRQALALMEELGDPRGIGEFSLYLASGHLDAGLLEQAAASLERGRTAVGETGNREQQAELLRLEGELALAGGRAAAARRAFEGALTGAEESGGLVARLGARLGLARAEARAGSAARAVSQLEAVARDAAAAGATVVELEALASLAEAEGAAGRPAAAESSARQGLDLVDRVGGWVGAWRFHRALAAALAARGDAAAAARAAAAAGEELARIRRQLPADAREGVDRMSATLAAAVPSGPKERLADVHDRS